MQIASESQSTATYARSSTKTEGDVKNALDTKDPDGKSRKRRCVGLALKEMALSLCLSNIRIETVVGLDSRRANRISS